MSDSLSPSRQQARLLPLDRAGIGGLVAPALDDFRRRRAPVLYPVTGQAAT